LTSKSVKVVSAARHHNHSLHEEGHEEGIENVSPEDRIVIQKRLSRLANHHHHHSSSSDREEEVDKSESEEYKDAR